MNENSIMVAKINAQRSKFCHEHGRSFPEKGEEKCHENGDDRGGKGEIGREGLPLRFIHPVSYKGRR